MKKDAVRKEVAGVLKQLGFSAKQYRWHGAELHVVIGGEFRTFKFPAGKAMRETFREIGRLEGLTEAFDGIGQLSPPSHPKANGVAHAL